MRNRLAGLAVLAALSTFAWSTVATGQGEWPRFRGPNGAGTGVAPGVASVWTTANYQWTVDLGGVGHGSPVVWGDRIFLTSGDAASGKSELVAVDARTGTVLWRREQPGGERHLHAANSYASTTPAVDVSGIYLSGATPDGFYVVGYSHEGVEKWRRAMGSYECSHGFASSPIVVAGIVCIVDDQLGESAIVALDPQTGKDVWRTSRPVSDKAAYSTPCVIDIAGKPAIVTLSKAAGIAAYDAGTGKQLWHLADVFPARCVSSPVVGDGLVFGACGSGGGGKLMLAVPVGQAAPKQEAYRLARRVPYVPTPLIANGLMYLWHDRGTVACVKVATGETLWQERIGGNYFSSPVALGDAVLAVSNDGEVVILAGGADGGRVIARNDLSEPSQATPAIAHGKLYVRTVSKLHCIAGVATSRSVTPATN